MIRCMFLLLYIVAIHSKHFNGGTIRWMPADPYDNSSSVAITIIQSYSWAYPTISCTTNVPISTAGRSTQNSNLTCVVDCSTDGGYSTNPINILTDCTSMSSSLNMMTSQRAVNITLTSNANFYLAFVGSAWAALNNPAQAGLQWSIVSFVDLRIRSDGFINTPPVASIVSPQYVIVNRTTQIQIPTSDVNTGDDVRCRWSKYTPGYRRRKRSEEEQYTRYEKSAEIYEKVPANEETVHNRRRRGGWPLNCASCNNTCILNCLCTCAGCKGTTCSGSRCTSSSSCPVTASTIGTTTVETPGTLKSTSSYPHRQAIDECGGICYPSAVPNGTTLSNCSMSFTGLVPNTWYAIAIQVEDFINETSLIPMSSVPIQFLVYVMPEPECSNPPVIIPLQGCLEVTVGVSISFNLSVLNMCNSNVSDITDVVVSSDSIGIQVGSLTDSPTNASLVYVTLTWTPQANQLGSQQLCMIAYKDDLVQSAQYCVTFIVTTSSGICTTTTTTPTTATTISTTSTATSTTTTVSSTTTTSTSSTSKSTTFVSTTTVSALTTTSVSTTTITATSSTSSTSKSTTFITTTATTTMAITAVTTKTTTSTPGKGTSWGLLAGLLAAILPLALCTICCLYRYLWSSTAKRRRQEEEENRSRCSYLASGTESTLQTTATDTHESPQIEVPKKSYQVYDVLSRENTADNVHSTTDNQGSILISIYNRTNANRANSVLSHNTEQSFKMGNAWMQPLNRETVNNDVPISRPVTLSSSSVHQVSSFRAMKEPFNINDQSNDPEDVRAFSTPPFNTRQFSVSQSQPKTTSRINRSRSVGGGPFNFQEWARIYLFGHEHNTGIPRIPKPS